MYHDLSYLRIPLPEDIQRLKAYGDYKGAFQRIDRLLEQEKVSAAMKERLRMEKEILHIMEGPEYPFSFTQAADVMRKNIRDFQEMELTELKENGDVDWIYKDGEVYFQNLFFENLIKTKPEYAVQLIQPDEDMEAEKKQDLLNRNVRQMKTDGQRTVKFHLHVSIGPAEGYERPGERVRVHLPVPQECKQVSGFRILHSVPEVQVLAEPDAVQRTAYFETVLDKGEKVELDYEYISHVEYVELKPEQAGDHQPSFDTHEEYPHMVFTPYLRLLLNEILQGEENPVRKARKIYDYVTTHVMYSFMREYYCIENISEYAAVNLKGDCGVQALLFITLCRMAGIPARWQSGLYVTPFYTGCHDWAQFYIAPYGWVFADLSFGGSAYRAGELERWDYYFGNLDIFRMPANSGIQAELNPPKRFLRCDEIDSQVGELEFEDSGLLRSQLITEQRLVSMEELCI